jgi:hypothetical protein
MLGQRLLSSRHKKMGSNSSYAFPNEYSIPTIPIPPSPSQDIESIKPPESPPRFRKRNVSADSTPTKLGSRETSVRFALPDDDDSLPQHTLSPPNPISRTQQLLDDQADSFDSAKSYLSAYHTPNSPSKGITARWKPTTRQQTPAPQQDTPSKLLRTLSRVTYTPRQPDPSYQDSFHTPFQEESEEEVSIDEAEKTLDSIIESAEDASSRIRKVLEKSRQERSLRQSPPTTRTDVSMEETPRAEMSVWGEQSFFRRMAKKAPGGWAFTPQPKLGRIMELEQVEEDIVEEEGVEIVKVFPLC